MNSSRCTPSTYSMVRTRLVENLGKTLGSRILAVRGSGAILTSGRRQPTRCCFASAEFWHTTGKDSGDDGFKWERV